MTSKSIRFTKEALLKIKPPSQPVGAKGSVYDTYKDSAEKGLQLIVTQSGNKTFYFRAKINGRSERVRLGGFPSMSIESARKKARDTKSQKDLGLNPNQEKRRLRDETTFGELFDIYITEHAKPKLKSWHHNQKRYENHLSDWKNHKLSHITQDVVRKRFNRITEAKGGYAANVILSLISKMFDIAINEKGWSGNNPAKGIKKNREISRDRFVQGDELGRFFNALKDEPNEMLRDYFLMCLFTGQRKRNVMAMRWDQIDFAHNLWRIPDTKNGEPHIVVLIDPVMEILQKRKEVSESQWVFPSERSQSGHLEEPKKNWKAILDRAGIKDLRIHDLRRTMGSYQAIAGASLPIIGKSLGQKSIKSTEIYARLQNDPVRASMDMAAKSMLELAKVK